MPEETKLTVEQIYKMPADELLKIPMAQWDSTFSGIHPNDLRCVSNALVNAAVLAARMSTYLDTRGGDNGADAGHEKAVEAQNRIAEKVRKVFNFQYPKSDITF